MSIKTPEELAGMRRVGALVARTLRELRGAVRPGITTGALDAHAARIFASEGARSGPQLTYDFPGAICISVNEEVVHGIPGPRKLREGDLVTLDVTPELDGFLADAAITVPVGRPRPEARRLLRAATAAWRPRCAPRAPARRCARSAAPRRRRRARAAPPSSRSSGATASGGACTSRRPCRTSTCPGCAGR
jgi:methionyl aminopeptidase